MNALPDRAELRHGVAMAVAVLFVVATVVAGAYVVVQRAVVHLAGHPLPAGDLLIPLAAAALVAGVPLALVVGALSVRLAAAQAEGRAAAVHTRIHQAISGYAASRLRAESGGNPRPSKARAAQGDGEILATLRVFDEILDAQAVQQEAIEEADLRRRRLIADLTHELATPCHAILGIADTLGHATLKLEPAQEQELLEALDQEASRLARLIGDLGELARLDDPDLPIRFEPVDLSRVVEQGARALAASYTDTTLSLEVPAGITVSGDPYRLAQVVANIVKNSFRHSRTPPGGGEAISGGNVRVALRKQKTGVELVVEDTGKGVDDSLLPLLGERFFRADPSRNRKTGGSGLGLSIVRGIVERHGGKVGFSRSQLGGLCVLIALPFAQDAAPRRSARRITVPHRN